MGPGPFPVEKEIPVISPVLTVRAVQIGAPPWQSMRPVDLFQRSLAVDSMIGFTGCLSCQSLRLLPGIATLEGGERKRSESLPVGTA